MMIRSSILVVCSLLLLSLVSCIKELEHSDANFESSLVINSVFSPDSLWTIEISNTASIFAEQNVPQLINQADIRLENLTNSTEIQFVNEGNGIYKSQGFKPTEGHFYEVFINAEGYDQAYSTTYVPTIGEVEVNTIEEVSYEGAKIFRINVSIEDDPFEENFYVWEVLDGDDTNEGGLKLFNTNDVTDLNDVVIETSPETFNPKFDGSFVFISDESTPNTESTISSSFYAVQPQGFATDSGGGSGGSASTGQELLAFDLRVRAVSKDLYDYMKSIELLRTQNFHASSVTLPEEIYSNVQGGHGIFGAYSQKVIPVIQ